MRKILCALALVPLVLAGCGSNVKKTLGMERTVPDEFTVVERAPLTVPPNFDLAPPRPGASRPQEPHSERRAENAVLGQAIATSEKASAGEKAFLQQMNTKPDPEIRKKLQGESDVAEASTVAEKLGISQPQSGKTLDPVEEAGRLKTTPDQKKK